MPVTQNFRASRNATWAPPLTYSYTGGALPLDGAHIAMQLRLYGGAADPALLTLNPIDFIDHDNGDGTRTLTLSPSIAVDALAALPGLNQPEAGSAQTFAHDIRITYADGMTDLLSSGLFTVSPGVTTV